MPWSAATAATAKCKRQFIGFARRRISTTVSPWTCSAIPKRRTELKLLKPSTTSERGKKVPLMMLKTRFILVLIFSVAAFSQGKSYQSQTAEVNGVKIHYLKAGTGKTPLVLIHGFGETSRMWIPLFEEFGKDYTIIAPDIRGLGDSSRPPAGYDKKTAAVDIRELVKSLGHERIDLVGHDIGLMVAYAYAAQYPNEVEKVALLEAPIPGIGAVWEQIYTNPLLWHFHFVNSPVALDLVKGRERTFLEH